LQRTVAIGSKPTAQIKRGGRTPSAVHGGPVDRVHRAGPRHGVTACVSMASACGSPAIQRSPRGATTVHPQAAQAILQISPSQFWKLQIYPSTYIKAFQLSPFLYA
jgi:hypothetical protein